MRLLGMKAITDYEKRSEPTVLRLIQGEDYPATKIAGGWESDTELIEQWRKGRILKGRNGDVGKNGV